MSDPTPLSPLQRRCKEAAFQIALLRLREAAHRLASGQPSPADLEPPLTPQQAIHRALAEMGYPPEPSAIVPDGLAPAAKQSR